MISDNCRLNYENIEKFKIRRHIIVCTYILHYSYTIVFFLFINIVSRTQYYVVETVSYDLQPTRYETPKYFVFNERRKVL